MFRAVIFALSVVGLSFQPVAPSQPQADLVKLEPGETPVPGECLTKQELDLIRRLQELKRPTIGQENNGEGDAQPPFNPHYLIGTWNIEGPVPESPFGAAGDMTGVETVHRINACEYEGVMQAKGPDGAFTVKSTIVYDRKARSMVRLEQDSRGFQLRKTGQVGGDAGGYFTHFWDVPEFTYKGQTIRLKGSTFFASPSNYRLRMQLSVNTQPYVNLGTVWWRREASVSPR
jgi:hypothetical protein